LAKERVLRQTFENVIYKAHVNTYLSLFRQAK
jgi:hypothetical protein